MQCKFLCGMFDRCCVNPRLLEFPENRTKLARKGCCKYYLVVTLCWSIQLDILGWEDVDSGVNLVFSKVTILAHCFSVWRASIWVLAQQGRVYQPGPHNTDPQTPLTNTLYLDEVELFPNGEYNLRKKFFAVESFFREIDMFFSTRQA